ncbi:MAG: hypothetical protein ACYTFA_00530 [Planctomycetota bacterium]|jgi:hypothetical protein
MRVRILAVTVTLFGLLGGCEGPRLGAIQLKQSGISSTIQPRVILDATSPSQATLSGVAELELESITINTTQVPVYLDPAAHKGVFPIEDEASEDDGEEETDWRDILDISGLLSGEDKRDVRKIKALGPKVDKALQDLWTRALKEGLKSAGITYGAEVALTVSVNSFLDDGGKQTILSEQPFFKVENLLLCNDVQDSSRASFTWERGKNPTDLENTKELIESNRRSGTLGVGLPLPGASLFELEFTLTERSNIAEALQKLAEELEKASKSGNLSVSWGGVAKSALKQVIKYLKGKAKDVLEEHEASCTFQVYLQSPVHERSFTVDAYIPIDNAAGTFDVKFREPFRDMLWRSREGLEYKEKRGKLEDEIKQRIEGLDTKRLDINEPGADETRYLKVLSFTAAISKSKRVVEASP